MGSDCPFRYFDVPVCGHRYPIVMSAVTLKLPHSKLSKLSLFSIYRPPFSFIVFKISRYCILLSVLDDFQTLISSISTSPHDLLITGDFNIHVDDLTDSSTLQCSGLVLSRLTENRTDTAV